MTSEQLLALHDRLSAKAKAIMKDKNHDYTSGSADPFHNFRGSEYLGVKPEKGILLRIQDKMMRLSTFINKGKLNVANESAEDAIIDIINYCILIKGLIEDTPVPNGTPIPLTQEEYETLLDPTSSEVIGLTDVDLETFRQMKLEEIKARTR